MTALLMRNFFFKISLGLFLFGLKFHTSQCLFEIYQPQNLAAVDLEAEGSLTIFFFTSQSKQEHDGLNLKVDVMGFADPSGWPNTKMSLVREASGVRGSVVVSGLVPGAVKIRLRLLTPDGTDAIGDQALELFLDPSRYVSGYKVSSCTPIKISSQLRFTSITGFFRTCSDPSLGFSHPSSDCRRAC
jgi:hypothetical protein